MRTASSGAELPLWQVAVVGFVGICAGLACALSPLVGVGLAVVLIAAIVSLLRPDAVAVMVVGIIYSNAAVVATNVHGLPRLLALVVPVALLIPIGHRLLVRRESLVVVRVLPLVVVFGTLQAASTLVARSPGVALTTFLEFLTEGLALFVLITNSVVGQAQIRRAVWALLAVGAFLGALSLYQTVTGTFDDDYLGFAGISNATVSAQDDTGDGTPRLAGPIGETNRYAQILLVLAPIALVQALHGRTVGVRLTSAAATALITGGVVLTYSRGAAVGLALVLMVAAVIKLVKVRWLLVVVAVVAGGLATVPAYTERLATLGSVASAADPLAAGGADGAIQGRATENIAAVLVMRDHPLLGVGPGGFPEVYQEYIADLGIRPHEGEREAHNLYAGLGAEVGTLGLLCFLLLVGVVMRDLVRVRRRYRHTDPERAVVAGGFLLALSAYLISGVFLHLAFQRYFWLLLALAACASVLPHRQPSGPAETESVRWVRTSPVG